MSRSKRPVLMRSEMMIGLLVAPVAPSARFAFTSSGSIESSQSLVPAATSDWSGVISFLLGNRELADKRLVEVIDVVEILASIAIGLRHFADPDQVIDDLAEVARRADAPICKHQLGHQAELVGREAAQRLAEILAGDVSRMRRR